MGDAGAAGKGEESLDALKLKCKVPERIVLLMCSACRLWLRSAGYGGEQLCGTQGKQSLWGREPVWATCTDRRICALLLDDFSHAFALNSHRCVVVFIPDPCADAQALEHTAKILQQKLNNFEVKNRKLELQKRKVLDDLLTLEGYWSGAYIECTATVG